MGIDEEYLVSTPNQDITGMIATNQIWYENEYQKKYLFIGESNISWYVYKKESQKFLELDNPSGSIITMYESLGELLEQFLTDYLA